MEIQKFRIVFPGKPIPLSRPRLGRFKVYDPQFSLKKKIIQCLMQQKHAWKKIDGPICIDFEFRMPIPKYKQKDKNMENVYHVIRPDVSNMVKFYEDVCQGHVYDNDSQVVEITARKVYAAAAETIMHVWSKHDNL